jgi:hypothetical protein
MNMNEIRSTTGPGAARPVTPARPASEDRAAKHTPTRPSREDTVQISDEARDLARSAGLDTTLPLFDMPKERIDRIRAWIREGGHNAPEVAETIARRLLDSGDL